MTPMLKTFICAALFAAWGSLVFAGMAPVESFVAALRDALIALGVFQATITKE